MIRLVTKVRPNDHLVSSSQNYRGFLNLIFETFVMVCIGSVLTTKVFMNLIRKLEILTLKTRGFFRKLLIIGLIVLMLYIPANNFSVMSRRFPVFLGWTSTKHRIVYTKHRIVSIQYLWWVSNQLPSNSNVTLSNCAPPATKILATE